MEKEGERASQLNIQSQMTNVRGFFSPFFRSAGKKCTSVGSVSEGEVIMRKI